LSKLLAISLIFFFLSLIFPFLASFLFQTALVFAIYKREATINVFMIIEIVLWSAFIFSLGYYLGRLKR